jgi:hypothetical protein
MQTIARKTRCRYFGTEVFKIFAAASAVLALFVLLFPSPMRAQLATADILGTVTDTTGAVVPGAKVTLLNTGTGISVSQNSNEVGEFLFSHVQIGTFKVKVEANGFKTFSTSGLVANTGDRVRVSAKLEIGNQVETVEVEASAAVELQTDSSDIGSLISSNAVADMPINGRNYYDLIGLEAGTSQSSGGGDPTDDRPVMAFSANGQSSTYNNNMIDGMDNNERSLGEVAVEPSLDALQEVKVETNMYSAEYSRTGGGIANLITKSGTNKFHGTAYDFMRNDAFDAYPWTSSGENKTKAELRQNQFGGSLGGPILKNKAFFFGDYQGWRLINGAVSKVMVPNEAEYESIHASSGTADILLQDPYGYGSDGVLGDALNIPAASINKLGLAYLMQSPKPTCSNAGNINGACDSAATFNWYGASNTVQNADTYDARIDYHFNDKDTLFGRYSYNKTSTTKPGGTPATAIVNGDSHTYWPGTNINPVVETNLALDYVHIFSPKTLFEGKASYLRSNMTEKSPNDSYWTTATTGSNDCGSDSNYCYDTPGVYGLPLVSFSSGDSSLYPNAKSTATGAIQGDGGELGYVENVFQYNGALTLNRKAHSIKIGATLIRRQVEAPTSSTTGITFDAWYTGNVLGDMAEGLSTYVNGRKTMIVPRFRMWEPSAYIQDDWRASKALTLNLGVRYDIYTPWTERYGHLSNFNLDSDLLASPSLLGDYDSSPTGNVKTDFGDVSPRVGFAYSFNNGNIITKNMVLRGGYGFSYFPGNTNGRGEFEMLNTPFIWQMGCGVASLGHSACAATNQFVPSTDSNGYWIASDGGYNLQNGLPRATYDAAVAVAETPSLYASAFSGNYFVMPNFKPSYLEQFNLQLQKQLGNNIFTAGFVGNLGRRIPTQQNLNQQLSATSPYPMTANHSWMDQVSVIEAISGANSAWEAGEATYERRLSFGLTANVNYTWSRTEAQGTGASECVLDGCPMDNGSGQAVLVNGWKQYNYDGSTSHRAAGMVSYDIPYGKNLHGVLGAVAKGWALNGTGYWQTGSWNQITSSINQSGMSSRVRMGTEFPNKVPGVSAKPRNQSLANWVNPDAFALQAPDMLGNANRSYIEGPRSRNVDLGFGKTFSLLEGFKLQFRAESFNFTNTVNYAGGAGGPGGGPGGPPGGPGGGGGTFSISSYQCTPTGPGPCQAQPGATATTSNGFGDINSASSSPRIFQFGLKLIY